MEKHKLLKLRDRRGGRGRGVLIEMLWIRKGEELAARRRRAQELSKSDHEKPQEDSDNSKTATHRHTTIPRSDSENRVLTRRGLMSDARRTIAAKLNDKAIDVATKCFGKWLWKERPSLSEARRVLEALKEEDRISVPRWATTVPAIFRWFRSLISKLLRWGTVWWEQLRVPVERRRLKGALAKVKASVENEKACPICTRIHDRYEWEEGVTKGGKLVCPGWARIKLAALREEPMVSGSFSGSNHPQEEDRRFEEEFGSFELEQAEWWVELKQRSVCERVAYVREAFDVWQMAFEGLHSRQPTEDEEGKRLGELKEALDVPDVALRQDIGYNILTPMPVGIA